MSQSGLSAPASPDPDLSGTSSSNMEGLVDQSSRPESRSSISSSSIVDQAAESSRLSSPVEDAEKKSTCGEVIGLDENAQSGGLLDEQKQELAGNRSSNGEDSLEMVSDDDMDANENCKDPPKKKVDQVLDPLKDTELDFEEDVVEEEHKKTTEEKTKPEDDGEEDGECEGENESELDQEKEEPEEGEELEEGEVSSEEDVGKHARMEPRPVCRFYSKGNCTWGNNCRFVHPGVLDKGNYNMFAPARSSSHNGPPGMYERPFDRPPVVPLIPPADWGNAGPRVSGVRPLRHPQATEPLRSTEATAGAESAWERGLRQAKEMLKKSSHRKETDIDFEEKKLNLGLGEEELDKENDYYTRPASPILHGDAPPSYNEPEVEQYHKYPPPPEGRWPPSRYPPPHRHHPPGYPYPYEGRRPYPESEFREREYYHPDEYDRQHHYGPKSGERDHHPSSVKTQAPPPHDKRWPDERYVEAVPSSAQRNRSDEWWDPWMRSRSPGGGGPSVSGGGGAPSGVNATSKGGRRRSYSSGSSFSTSSTSSSSSSSSYSSSTSRSSRSSASSRSSSEAKTKRKHSKKQKGVERSKGSHKIVSHAPVPKHKSIAPVPTSPSHSQSRKPIDKRGIVDRSPVRNRDWSTSSSRSRSQSRSPSASKQRTTAKGSSLPVPAKQYNRGRSSSHSSSSSEWESSPRSDGGRSRRTANRGRRDFAERKELRTGNLSPAHTIIKSKIAPEPPKPEPKQQIKMTLKSAAPPLRKLSNRFDDDSEDEDWEKDKVPSVKVPQPPSGASSGQTGKKRGADSPPLAMPLAKVAATSPQKSDKTGKKSTASRREELLKQLKAVEEAIAKKRSKLPS